MKRVIWKSVILSSLLMVIGVACVYAQEPQLPINWGGQGGAAILGQEGMKELQFQVKLKIDTDGWATGEFYNEEGKAQIEHLFYSSLQSDGSRKLYFVLKTNEDSPRLILLNCRVIGDSFLYAEVQMKEFEENGELEKGLGIGDKTAQEIYEDYMPSGLKKGLSSMKPIGCLKIEGGYSS